jgi:hypothetical protein
MANLQSLSIILEALIVLVSLGIATRKGKLYGWGLALTFAIYVYYDAAKLYGWESSASTLAWAFFIATISALLSVLAIYRHR